MNESTPGPSGKSGVNTLGAAGLVIGSFPVLMVGTYLMMGIVGKARDLTTLMVLFVLVLLPYVSIVRLVRRRWHQPEAVQKGYWSALGRRIVIYVILFLWAAMVIPSLKLSSAHQGNQVDRTVRL